MLERRAKASRTPFSTSLQKVLKVESILSSISCGPWAGWTPSESWWKDLLKAVWDSSIPGLMLLIQMLFVDASVAGLSVSQDFIFLCCAL
jgi:hypothetical protein